MAATLACYGVALAVEHWDHQHVDLVVLAVAITIMLARGEIERPSRWRLLALLLLPAAAAAASYVGQKMAWSDHVGVLFAQALGACIAVRRFGPAWSKAGPIVTLPFVAALVTPFTPQGRRAGAVVGGHSPCGGGPDRRDSCHRQASSADPGCSGAASTRGPDPRAAAA